MSEFKGWDIVITNELGATLKTIENRTFHQVILFWEIIQESNVFGYVYHKNYYGKTEKILFRDLVKGGKSRI